MQDRAFANPKIEFRWNTVVEAVKGNGAVEALVLRDTETDATSELPVSGMFVAIGHDPNTALFRGQIDLDADGYVAHRDRARCRRRSTGVFAGGDVQDRTYRQAITAAGTGLHGGARSRAIPRGARGPRRPAGVEFALLRKDVLTVADGIVTLTDATFDEGVGGADAPVLVDFWAEWCGPCKMIAPVLEDIAKEHAGRIQIAKLNVDDNPNIARRYDVMSIPTLLVFDDGEVKKRLVGAKGKAQLLEELSEFIA